MPKYFITKTYRETTEEYFEVDAIDEDEADEKCSHTDPYASEIIDSECIFMTIEEKAMKKVYVMVFDTKYESDIVFFTTKKEADAAFRENVEDDWDRYCEDEVMPKDIHDAYDHLMEIGSQNYYYIHEFVFDPEQLDDA